MGYSHRPNFDSQDGREITVGSVLLTILSIAILIYVLPGFIDAHSHSSLQGINEGSGSITSQVWTSRRETNPLPKTFGRLEPSCHRWHSVFADCKTWASLDSTFGSHLFRSRVGLCSWFGSCSLGCQQQISMENLRKRLVKIEHPSWSRRDRASRH